MSAHPVDIALAGVDEALQRVDYAPVRCAGALSRMMGDGMGSDFFDESPILAAFMKATHAAMVEGADDPEHVASELLEKCIKSGRGLIESKLCAGRTGKFNPAVYLAGLIEVATVQWVHEYGMACAEQAVGKP
jgi:hypothetical protein